MTQAEVHYALAMDRELWQASQVDPSLLDPIVRVASLPGTSRPIVVVRDYQGPQGYYLESFRITDAAGRAPAPVRTGEAPADAASSSPTASQTVLPGLELVRGDEHTVTFTLGDEDVAAIPMFVEVGEGGDPAIAAKETFAKALGKGNVLWLVVPPGGNGAARRPKRKVPRRGLTPTERQQPAWYVQQGDRVYVLTGPSEQQIAGLANASTVEIVARSKEHRSQVSRVPATARVVPGDDPLFERVAQAGLGRRLNLPDGEAALERWRATCTLVELTPDFAALTGHGGTSFGGAAAGQRRPRRRAALRPDRLRPPLRAHPPPPRRKPSVPRTTSTSRPRSTRRCSTSSSPRARASASPAPRPRPPTCARRRRASSPSAEAATPRLRRRTPRQRGRRRGSGADAAPAADEPEPAGSDTEG